MTNRNVQKMFKAFIVLHVKEGRNKDISSLFFPPSSFRTPSPKTVSVYMLEEKENVRLLRILSKGVFPLLPFGLNLTKRNPNACTDRVPSSLE